MSTNATRAALATVAAPETDRNLFALIARQRPEIEKALPPSVGVERFERIIRTEMRRNPRLFECDEHSVLGALMLVAQLGLEPGPLGLAYLVPFRDGQTSVCILIVGYKGMIELAGRSERVAGIQASLVYEGDEWSGIRKTERGPKFEHIEGPPSSRGALVGGYCSWLERLGPRVLVPRVSWCWPEDFAAAKAKSPAGRKGVGPWASDEVSMQLQLPATRRHGNEVWMQLQLPPGNAPTR